MGNIVKTAVLLSILTIILVFVGGLIGGTAGMVSALIFGGIMNVAMWWFSDKIVLMMYRAKPLSEDEASEVYRIVRKLTLQAAMPMPKLYKLPMDIPNAFATGRDPRHAACAVTEGILRLLNEDELEGVLAHELSHIKHRDILIASVVATIAGAISILAYMARWAAFGESRNRDARLRMIGLLVVSLFAPLAAMLVQLAISRSEEYRADASGARISKKPLGLASALNKLSLYKAQGFQRQEPNPATAHMFIVNPLSASGFNALFSTHPPIEKRILELKKIAATQPS